MVGRNDSGIIIARILLDCYPHRVIEERLTQ